MLSSAKGMDVHRALTATPVVSPEMKRLQSGFRDARSKSQRAAADGGTINPERLKEKTR
jgi:hypothetical protein